MPKPPPRRPDRTSAAPADAAQISRAPRPHDRPAPRPPAPEDFAVLYGYHAVAAALSNPRRVLRRIVLTQGAAGRLAEALARRAGPEPQIVEPRELDKRLGADAVHQGMLVEAEFLPEPSLQSLCALSPPGLPPLLLVLDQVTDPHNVGALLRSASVFGVCGVVMTRHHSPPLSGVLAKAASGALDHVPVVVVTNLARALEELADLGVRRIGLEGEGDIPLESQAIDGPTALVLGAEGKGLRRLTRENCDVLCRISTFGALKSLNVSNAAAIALHALRTRSPVLA